MNPSETAVLEREPGLPLWSELELDSSVEEAWDAAEAAEAGAPDRATPTAAVARTGEVAGMSLDEFASAGLVLEVRSPLLDDTFLLASDNATVESDEERVVYRAAELVHLEPLGAEGLRQIHRIKRLLGGSVVEVAAKLATPAALLREC